MNIIDWVFVGTLIVVFCLYFLYLLILKMISSLRRPSLRTSENLDSLPCLSVIVPTFNEEVSIGRKLESLNAISYPKEKCEIIVVDSGSTDGTCQIVEQYKKTGVILLRQMIRTGKASALNLALKNAHGDVVVLTDANAEFDAQAPRLLVQKFDDKTGAVLPRLVPSGRLNFWDRAFYKFHHMYKSLESDADSVFIVFGELFAFKKELVKEIDEKSVSDDLEIAMTIRSKNYRIKYSPDVEVNEKVPTSQKEVRIQRTRRVFGIIQALIKNFRFLLNPEYGVYGLLIFPTHFLQMTLGPFLVFSFLSLFTIEFLMLIFGSFQPLLAAGCLIVLVVLLIVLYFSVALAKKAISLVYNFLATQVYIIIALVAFMRGRKYHVWEKISSTR